uniref:Uncharacterized protein n=1 Tax=Globodera rostochiensis TaxID=31243 RepID=A0A914I280_GLORO
MLSSTLGASDDSKSEALANAEGILFALTEQCNKIRDKKCKKASFTYFQKTFTCEWAEKQINVVTGEIGW